MGEYSKLMTDEINYCRTNNTSISQNHGDDQNTIEAIEAMADNYHWRSFSEGLKEMMEKCGYTGSDEPGARIDFILERLSEINVNITPATVKDWVSGKRTPDPANENSREKMYQLCFALHADEIKTVWFFEHVFFSKCFDYHRPNELVYKFCISHGMDYSVALSMINRIKTESVADPVNVMTMLIRKDTDDFNTSEQLIDYINSNAGRFARWNVTAKNEIKQLRSMLMDEKCRDSDELVRKLMRSGKSVREYLPRCSLLIRWKLSDPYCLEDAFSGLQLDSVDFLLKAVMGTADGITKRSEYADVIPDAVKKSFPNKKSLSDILDDSKNASYVSVRKALVFLKFVHFWCNEELVRRDSKFASDPCAAYSSTASANMSQKDLFDTFIDEMNEMLLRCGYAELFAGNPFDWLFMYSATRDFPLSFLGDFIADISETGE